MLPLPDDVKPFVAALLHHRMPAPSADVLAMFAPHLVEEVHDAFALHTLALGMSERHSDAVGIAARYLATVELAGLLPQARQAQRFIALYGERLTHAAPVHTH